MEMRAAMWRDGALVVEETNVLHMTQYLARELVMMLEGAGFAEIQVRGDYTDAPATREHGLLRLHRPQSVNRRHLRGPWVGAAGFEPATSCV